ncbi:hypothetical protein [Microcoleus asticus]|nr:hypothetical protein [Microcoleus asticus]
MSSNILRTLRRGAIAQLTIYVSQRMIVDSPIAPAQHKRAKNLAWVV